jgi:2-(1,2-epoxy-1,2-dihydrophenyl)acetyl-CoA isomerase
VTGAKQAGDLIRLEVAAGVATITLGSIRTRNAINVELSSALCACVQEADRRDDVGVILLRADGPAWSVGGAVDAMLAAGDGVHEFVTEAGRTLNPVIATLHESEKVTIAAVHGAAVGAGLGLMAAHDLVLAAEGTVFTVGARALAASPDAGCTYFLARDVGYRRAMELYLSDERFDAVSAMQLGLVNRVVADEDLHAEAARLAARSPQGHGGLRLRRSGCCVRRPMGCSTASSRTRFARSRTTRASRTSSKASPPSSRSAPPGSGPT